MSVLKLVCSSDQIKIPCRMHSGRGFVTVEKAFYGMSADSTTRSLSAVTRTGSTPIRSVPAKAM